MASVLRAVNAVTIATAVTVVEGQRQIKGVPGRAMTDEAVTT